MHRLREKQAMQTFEWTIILLLAAIALAGLARRVGAPYPTFLAFGGAALAFVPHAPQWTLDPGLALALFVAPVLLDAAYDTSLRDRATIGFRSPASPSSRSVSLR
jgi:monovalent cation/hydrogen antiporter